MKPFFLFLLTIFAWNCAQAESFVDIIVNGPRSTPNGESIYLTGSTRELCQWRPNCLPLEKIGINTYKARVGFSTRQTILFKVTRGSWQNEAVDKVSIPYANFEIDPMHVSDTMIIDLVNWKDQPPLGITGQLDELLAFYSPELQNYRDIHVWTPPEYQSNQSSRFPVLYVHDGQNVFNPKTSFSGIDLGLDETLTQKIAEGRFASVIVVAIDSNGDREMEYDHSLKGPFYAKFVAKTLKSYIDKTYRTIPDRAHTATMGASLGALISLEILWTYPHLFSGAAGFSMPAFYQNDQIIQMVAKLRPPVGPVKIYFDHGDQGEDAFSYEASCLRLQEKLLAQGLPTASVEYVKYPWASHDEISWSRRALVPLNYFYLR